MATRIQDLDRQIPIVDEHGLPTPFFMQFLQQRGIGQTDQGQQIIDIEDQVEVVVVGLDDLEHRNINTSAPLSGGGDLSADRTISHDNSGVTPGTYGDATHVPQIVVDAKGHLTSVTDIPISGGGGGGSNTLVSAHIDCSTPSTPVITGGVNAASITKTGTGLYRIVFTTPIVITMAGFNGGGRWGSNATRDLIIVGIERSTGNDLTTTYVDLSTMSGANGGYFDCDGWFSFTIYDATI